MVDCLSWSLLGVLRPGLDAQLELTTARVWQMFTKQLEKIDLGLSAGAAFMKLCCASFWLQLEMLISVNLEGLTNLSIFTVSDRFFQNRFAWWGKRRDTP